MRGASPTFTFCFLDPCILAGGDNCVIYHSLEDIVPFLHIGNIEPESKLNHAQITPNFVRLASDKWGRIWQNQYFSRSSANCVHLLAID